MNKDQTNGGLHLLLSMKLADTTDEHHRVGYQFQNSDLVINLGTAIGIE
jgi:hypothetical protein